ncbi:DUF3899 domain-containing protein [Oceanobacillus bengalensis]|nr:DUF3899 domain-containing protein [Oceanobacillus bengalensis]
MNKKGIFLLLNITVTVLLVFIFSDGYGIIHFVNGFFFISFAYLIVLLFQLTIRGGFYNGITFGFRRFRSIMSRDRDYLEEWKDKPLPSEKTNDTFYSFLKFQTIALIGIFLLLMFLYYLL